MNKKNEKRYTKEDWEGFFKIAEPRPYEPENNNVEDLTQDWMPCNIDGILNKINGNYIYFKEEYNGFVYKFPSCQIEYLIKQDVTPKSYYETKEFVNVVLRKYGLEEVE